MIVKNYEKPTLKDKVIAITVIAIISILFGCVGLILAQINNQYFVK